MKVKFIKDHFSGIKEGTEVNSSEQNCKRWIDLGFAEEVTAEKPKRKRRTKAEIKADNDKSDL